MVPQKMRLLEEIKHVLNEVELLFPDLSSNEKLEKAENISGIPLFMIKWLGDKQTSIN